MRRREEDSRQKAVSRKQQANDREKTVGSNLILEINISA
jgi:hypothetical protein